MHPTRVAIYRKHLTHVEVDLLRRCARCGMRLTGASGMHGQLGDLCMETKRVGRTIYRAGLRLPGMRLDPKDFPEHREKVREALALARRERRAVVLAL